MSLFMIYYFCASGMGMTTYTAARILKGQLQNQTGEETVMTMDTFPNVGLVKVKHLHRKIHTICFLHWWGNQHQPVYYIYTGWCIYQPKKRPYISANTENQFEQSCPIINLQCELTERLLTWSFCYALLILHLWLFFVMTYYMLNSCSIRK